MSDLDCLALRLRDDRFVSLAVDFGMPSPFLEIDISISLCLTAMLVVFMHGASLQHDPHHPSVHSGRSLVSMLHLIEMEFADTTVGS
jgi:hypothetical protein